MNLTKSVSAFLNARIRAVNGSDAVLSDLTATDVRNRRRYTWKSVPSLLRTRGVNGVHNDTVLNDLAVLYVRNMGTMSIASPSYSYQNIE